MKMNHVNGDHNTEDFGNEVQKVRFEGRDDFQTIQLVKDAVEVGVNKSIHQKGSSCVKVSQVVSCVWDRSFLHGKQVAVDKTRTYLAYGIKLPRGGTGNTAVRVVDIQTQQRALVRGLKGTIRDLSFSHHPTRTILAVIDELGTLSVCEILKNEADKSSELGLTILLHVDRPADLPTPFNRVIWCGYVPDNDIEEAADDSAFLLFVSRSHIGELWNVSLANERYGNKPIRVAEVNEGFCELLTSGSITDATFSPDGSALAVASVSGMVQFFEVEIHKLNATYQPKILHEWTPHSGKPVTFLTFLDNLIDHTPDTQYWKFAITGASDNTEIKVWSCENWECHQTLRFSPQATESEARLSKPLQLNVGIDLTRKFLVLSDIENSVLYVGEIAEDEKVAKINSLTELLFAFPVISFAIYDASDNDQQSKQDFETFGEAMDEIELHLFIVQPTALSDCMISYSRSKEVDTVFEDKGKETDTYQRPQEAEDKYELEVERPASREESPDIAIEEPVELDHAEPDLATIKPPMRISAEELPISLMTPDQVASPGKPLDLYDSYLQPPRPASQQASAFSPLNADLVTSTLKPHTPPQPTANDLLNFGHGKRMRSGASSPSVEVASILDQGVDAFRRMNLQQDLPGFEPQPGPSKRSPMSELLHGATLPAPIAPVGNLVSIPPPPHEHVSQIHPHPPQQQNNNVMDILADVMHGMQSPQLAPPIQSPTRWQPSGPSPPLPDLARRESPAPANRDIRDLENLVVNAVRNLESATARLDSIQSSQDSLRSLQNQIQHLREEQRQLGGEITSICHALRMDNFEKRIENAVCTQIANYQEALTLAVSQTVANSVPARIENHVKALLVPAINRGLEPIRTTIQQEVESLCESNRRLLEKEVTKRLGTLEGTVKEHVSKLVQSKGLVDVWGQAVATSCQQSIQSVFKDMAQHQLIPSYDRACQQMFFQMNEAMTRGFNEVLQRTEAQLVKQKANDTKTTGILTAAIDKFSITTEQLSARLVNELNEQVSNAFTRSSAQFVQRITESIREEVSRATREQRAVIEQHTRSMTPAPSTVDMTVILSTLIAQSRYNEAFERVLAATDLNLVMFVCERIDPAKLFGAVPCPIRQPVLLSLIQQLSSDLKNRTDLKLKYLEEAVLVVDRTDPVISGHVGVVKDQVRRVLETLGGTEFAGRARRLSMVVASQM